MKLGLGFEAFVIVIYMDISLKNLVFIILFVLDKANGVVCF